MHRLRRRIPALLIGVALAALALGGTAYASHVDAGFATPSAATADDPLDLQVSLRSATDGSPIAAATVTFYADTDFAGVKGRAEVGSAMTDEMGNVVFPYRPRAAGEQVVRAEFMTEDGEIETVATTFTVSPSATQIHRPTSGVAIPGLNAGLVIAFVGSIWAVLMLVAIRVLAVARNGGSAVGAGARHATELPLTSVSAPSRQATA